MNNAEFCAGCPFSGDYIDEVRIDQASFESANGRNTERLVLRFTDGDGLQTNGCSVSMQKHAEGQVTEDVKNIIIARAVSRVVRCSGPSVSTEGRPRCRAVNETVLAKLLQTVVKEESSE